eukprot:g12753.t1
MVTRPVALVPHVGSPGFTGCFGTAGGCGLEKGEARKDSAWVQDDAGRICTETLDLHLKEHQFNEDLVPHWINEICEGIMARLNEQKKPFKYVVSCIIMQRNGAGLHTSTSCYWDAGNDGVYTYVWPREKSKDVVNKSMYCIVTVFGLEF